MAKKLLLRLWVRRLSCAVAILMMLGLVGKSLYAADRSKADEANTLKIGYLLALSGWYSVFDVHEERYLKATAQNYSMES